MGEVLGCPEIIQAPSCKDTWRPRLASELPPQAQGAGGREGDHWRPYSLRIPPFLQPHPRYPGLSLTLKVEGGGRPLHLER